MLGDFLPRKMFDEPDTLFLLAWIYTVIGIIIARITFPADPSLAGVAFTCLLLLSDKRILKKIEGIDLPAKKSLTEFIRNDMITFGSLMMAIFFGIFSVHMVASILLPSYQTSGLFGTQISAMNATAPQAGVFPWIFMNNTVVLLVIFALSMFIRGGGLFLIAWNASVWGTAFGVISLRAATMPSSYPFFSVIAFIILLLLFSLPHMLLEIFAYTNGMAAGRSAYISDLVSGKKNLKRAVLLVLISICLIFAGACIEAYLMEGVNAMDFITDFVSRL
jgi:uncharacterized membrane protein SpoIIM required for sporulation